jgi:hypothetical protein
MDLVDPLHEPEVKNLYAKACDKGKIKVLIVILTLKINFHVNV